MKMQKIVLFQIKKGLNFANQMNKYNEEVVTIYV